MASRDLTSVKDLLPVVLTRLARDTGRAKQLKPVWDEAVGPTIARSAVPMSLEGTALVVGVTSQRWANELSKRELELRERLQQRIGKVVVTRLVFRLVG